jgi:hypothetical protein
MPVGKFEDSNYISVERQSMLIHGALEEREKEKKEDAPLE